MSARLKLTSVRDVRSDLPKLGDWALMSSESKDYAQARHNFGVECPSGVSTLQDLAQDGRYPGFEHIASPINGDPNRVRRITLIRKQDTALAARLPCAVWNVVVSEMNTELMATGWAERNQMVPVEDMEIRKSCATEDAAKEEALVVLHELVAANEGCVSRVMGQAPFRAGVVDGGARWPRFMVVVNYDPGSA